ncbi:hypothetical protein JMK10_19985 [Rhodovulum sulfidophilum]|uniref:hypothetical protein n=1 Tax=Rhodovulum sulfidophilum TaxID=35806 RepID=UPI001921EF26|nr:hypothetical protein [Rhodovulum sulfidophilum]MBL3576452.1 hypothetical protein [Rhodovulum sulfidophilum]MCF4118988.1 hypothetical protein [Rhodovulum sulfidophilum]
MRSRDDYIDRYHKQYAQWYDNNRDLIERSDTSLIEEHLPHTKMSRIAAFFTEAEALVSALEDSHLDEGFSTSKTYEVVFETPVGPSRLALAVGRKIEKFQQYFATQNQILERLCDITSDDFGNDPDEWRHWLEIWKADPPLMYYR